MLPDITDVECWHCHAPEGEECVTRSGRPAYQHDTRIHHLLDKMRDGFIVTIHDNHLSIMADEWLATWVGDTPTDGILKIHGPAAVTTHPNHTHIAVLDPAETHVTFVSWTQ